MDDLTAAFTNFADAVKRQDQMTHAGVAIAVAAILDRQLERCLKRAILPMSAKMHKKLFDPFRPLGDFSSKIMMTYALGIISKDVFNELEKIRKIRNAFAHSSKVLHFGSAPIAPLFTRLTRPQSKATKPVTVFLESVKPIDTALDAYLLLMDKPST